MSRQVYYTLAEASFLTSKAHGRYIAFETYSRPRTSEHHNYADLKDSFLPSGSTLLCTSDAAASDAFVARKPCSIIGSVEAVLSAQRTSMTMSMLYQVQNEHQVCSLHASWQ